MSNKWNYRNGTWYIDFSQRGDKKPKAQTASQTAPKLSTSATRSPTSPASDTSRYGLLYELKVLWRGLSSPWLTVSFALLLGISAAFNISYYLQNKYLLDVIGRAGILQ